MNVDVPDGKDFEDTASDMKGCPFCGRPPRVYGRDARSSESSTTGRMYFASCHCGGYYAHAHQFAYTAEELMEKWNTRADV